MNLLVSVEKKNILNQQKFKKEMQLCKRTQRPKFRYIEGGEGAVNTCIFIAVFIVIFFLCTDSSNIPSIYLWPSRVLDNESSSAVVHSSVKIEKRLVLSSLQRRTLRGQNNWRTLLRILAHFSSRNSSTKHHYWKG